MNDREAMQQALEALEQSETTVPYEGFGMAHREAERKHQASITALRERLAQPEQEPAAWMVIGDGEYGEYTPGMHFDTVGYKEYWERRGYELQPLYTAPPQRQPLTDEQYFEIGQRHGLSSYKVEQIYKELEEAAHGIKVKA